MRKKVVVIGAGPGGYAAAIRSSQLGAETILIEKNLLGGICLNEGCIPTKILNHHGIVIDLIRRAPEFGIKIGEPELDFSEIIKRKDDVITTLRSGIEKLLEKNGVTLIQGCGKILHENSIEVMDKDGSLHYIDCDYIILATGSEPILPQIPGIEHAITSRELLFMKELPDSIVIIGGGIIGIEVGSILNMLGCKTTIIEMQDEILPGIDRGLASALHCEMEKKGIRLIISSTVELIKPNKKGYLVKTGNDTIIVESILAAVGRTPVLPPSNISFTMDGNAVWVNEYLRTNYKNIYCIGDANGKYQLAHVAYAEALIAAWNIMSENKKPIEYNTVPTVVYSFPEIASVGLSEEMAGDCLKSVFPYSMCGKAMAIGETSGFVKVLADKEHKELLGVHIIGHDASNLIGEAGISLRLEATSDEVSTTIHAHPSLSEMIMEACEGLNGTSIHK